MVLLKAQDVVSRLANMILYGDSGTGKTYLCSRLPNVLLLDFDEGLRSIPKDMIVGEGTVAGIREVFSSSREEHPSIAITLHDISQLLPVLECLRDKRFAGRFDTVVLDSVTLLVESVEVYMKTKFSKALTRDSISDDSTSKVPVLTLQGWGVALDRVKTRLIEFKQLPMNVIFTLHEETMRSAERSWTYPKLKGKAMLPTLQAMVDFGIRVEVNSGVVQGKRVVRRQLRCGFTTEVWSKARDSEGGLLKEVEPADLTALIQKINFGVDKSKDVVEEPELEPVKTNE